ncbi:MAG: DUF3883 domain-containing protein [Candidatus Competibacter sp.]
MYSFLDLIPLLDNEEVFERKFKQLCHELDVPCDGVILDVPVVASKLDVDGSVIHDETATPDPKGSISDLGTESPSNVHSTMDKQEIGETYVKPISNPPQVNKNNKSSGLDIGENSGNRRPEPDQPQMRLRSYVHPKHSDDYDNSEKIPEEAKRIGDKGEEIVRKAEEKIREVKEAINANQEKKNNRGYDIVSTLKSGETRYIEVKATRGSWGMMGVPVTYDQYKFALEKGEAWWLYVVEYVDRLEAEGGPIIHRIPNPFIKESPHHITEFRFDDGWREVASILGDKLSGPEGDSDSRSLS